MLREEIQAIVLDPGSQTCKAGFAGDDSPKSIIQTTLGSTSPNNSTNQTFYIGEQLKQQQLKKEELLIEPIIQRGHVTNLNNFEKLLRYTFYNELHTNPEEHPILLMEMPQLTKEERKMREKKTELLFETFQTPAFYLANHAVMGLYASGRTCGLVVNSGAGITHTVPIFEGYALPHATHRLAIGGHDLSLYLEQLFLKNKENFTSYFTNEKERFFTTQEMKEKYVNLIIPERLQCYSYYYYPYGKTDTFYEKTYELPDGQVIPFFMNEESLTKCGELLFQPNLLLNEFSYDNNNILYNNNFTSVNYNNICDNNNCDNTIKGIHEMAYQSIIKCDIEMRRDFYSNIVLSGGNTLIEGLENRLKGELLELAPRTFNVKTIAPPERKFLEWIGGSVFGSLEDYIARCWIPIDEYEEIGVNVVHRKCF